MDEELFSLYRPCVLSATYCRLNDLYSSRRVHGRDFQEGGSIGGTPKEVLLRSCGVPGSVPDDVP
jgi:hypothetical protein